MIAHSLEWQGPIKADVYCDVQKKKCFSEVKSEEGVMPHFYCMVQFAL